MAFFSFIRENARWLFGGFLLTFFSSFGQTFFISLSGGEIREAYGLSDGEFGGIYMIATLASAICLIQVGRLVDIFSVAKTAMIIIPLLALATFSMSMSINSVWVLGFTIFMLRLFGQGMMTQTAITAMGRWYRGHRGRAISLVVVGHQAGEATLPLVSVAIVGLVGWRMGWFYSGLFLLLVALPAIYLLMRVEREPRSTDAPEVKAAKRDWERREVFRDPKFWILNIGILAPSFIGTSIFFHQDYMIEYRGWHESAYAEAIVVMSFFTISFALIAGQIIDRFSVYWLLATFLLPLCVSCIFLATIEDVTGIYLFMAFMGMSYGFASTMGGALWPQLYGLKNLGSIRSIVVALMVLLTALGPGVTGFFIDWGIAFPDQVFYMAMYCIFASVVMASVAFLIMRSENS